MLEGSYSCARKLINNVVEENFFIAVFGQQFWMVLETI